MGGGDVGSVAPSLREGERAERFLPVREEVFLDASLSPTLPERQEGVFRSRRGLPGVRTEPGSCLELPGNAGGRRCRRTLSCSRAGDERGKAESYRSKEKYSNSKT